MKTKLLTAVFAVLALTVCLLGFTACTNHVHEFEITIVEPTCSEKGYVIHTCACGKEYINGETKPTGLHEYTDGICDACNDLIVANDLEFTLSDDESYYTVTGIGETTVSNFKIPETYNDKPVKEIGDSAFENCENLRTVLIPDSVTSIGNAAFAWCISITSMTIPDSVMSIGESAFNGCSSLETMSIPFVGAKADVTANYANQYLFGYLFGESQYEGGAKTLQYYWKSSTEAIGYYYCIPISLKAVNITASTLLYPSAFYGCSNLTSITFSDSITSIGSSAFHGCSSLTSITIPDSVTSIGKSAFSGCSSLEEMTIPFVGAKADVTANYKEQYPFGYIFGSGPYEGGVSTVQYFLKGSTDEIQYVYCIPRSLKTVNLTGTSFLYDSAFYGCSNLTSITFSDSITSIGREAFRGCSSLEKVYYNGDIESWCNIEFAWEGNPLKYAHNLYLNDELVTDLVIPNTVTAIKDYAFEGANCLKNITIPDSVTSIGDESFSGCSGITSITIPNSITFIGAESFSGCSKLTGVHITDMAAWCNIDFYNIYNNPLYYAHNLYLNNELLTNLVIPNTVTTIKDYAFSGASCLTNVTIGNGVASIGSYAFDTCSSLTSITIPDSVTSIGYYPFSGCSNLKYNEYDNAYYLGNDNNPYLALVKAKNTNYIASCVIHDNTKVIVGAAFNSCYNLTSVDIPNSVISIGDWSFAYCGRLTNVTIGNGVTSIGSYAFDTCSSLTSITIPDSVISIGESAFRNCSKLSYNEYDNATYLGNSNNPYVVLVREKYASITSFTINERTKIIYYNAFDGYTSLTSITIPDSVTSIGGWAFYGCSNLTSITIPDSVASIGYYAFYKCSSLTTINFSGTKEQWNAICNDSTLKYNSSKCTVYCTDGEITSENA